MTFVLWFLLPTALSTVKNEDQATYWLAWQCSWIELLTLWHCCDGFGWLVGLSCPQAVQPLDWPYHYLITLYLLKPTTNNIHPTNWMHAGVPNCDSFTSHIWHLRISYSHYFVIICQYFYTSVFKFTLKFKIVKFHSYTHNNVLLSCFQKDQYAPYSAFYKDVSSNSTRYKSFLTWLLATAKLSLHFIVRIDQIKHLSYPWMRLPPNPNRENC